MSKSYINLECTVLLETSININLTTLMAYEPPLHKVAYHRMRALKTLQYSCGLSPPPCFTTQPYSRYLTHCWQSAIPSYVCSNVAVMFCAFQNIVLIFQMTRHGVRNSFCWCMNNQWTISPCRPRCYTISPTAEDMFQPIPDLISRWSREMLPTLASIRSERWGRRALPQSYWHVHCRCRHSAFRGRQF